jgi:TolB protein
VGLLTAWVLVGRLASASLPPEWDLVGVVHVADGRTDLITPRPGIVRESLRWSPDSKRLLINVSFRNLWDVWEADLEGGFRNLISHPGADGGGAYSPDGRRIAFHSSRDNSNAVYVAADGGIPRRLTRDGRDWEPMWSPDGRRIAFARYPDGVMGVNAHLYVVPSDGGAAVRISTVECGRSREPAWSPDGRWIAFSGRVDTGSDIYVVSADGKKERRLPTGPGDDGFPRWSPDGSRIVYTGYHRTDTDARADIWTIRPDGADPRQLTRDGRSWAPDWSPDGRAIAYNREGHIWTMNADGSAQRSLTGTDPGFRRMRRSPVWSPDGRWIAFVVNMPRF